MNAKTLRYFTVFIISTALLCLEFIEIRIMGFTHWFHFVYFAITLALLGFAVSGTIISVNKKLQIMEADLLNAVSVLGFGISSFLAMFFAATIAPNTVELVNQIANGNYLPALKIYVPLMFLLTVPFIFSSLIICRALMDSGDDANRVYGFNLLGTAGGAILFLALIGPLGAYRLMYLLIAASALLGLIIIKKRSFLRGALIGTALLASLGIAYPDIYFSPKMDMTKNLGREYPHDVIDTEWTAMFRVDISKTSFGARLTIDGDAQTWAYRLTPDILASKEPYVPDRHQVSRHSVFRLVPETKREKALVIGAGGGMDVLAAYQAGYKKIDAVDIDPTRLRWLGGKYSGIISNLFNDPRITTHVADGRSFVLSSDEKYDAIIVYNVDSLAGVTTGAYNLVENYLYTQEAFQNYIDSLSAEGVLQVTRPNWGGATELYKMFNTFAVMLLNNGLDPNRHLLVVQNSYQFDFIASKAPFEAEDVTGLMALYKKYGEKPQRILYFGQFDKTDQLDQLHVLAEAAKKGTLTQIYDNVPEDIRPVSDNRPFFFENRKWEKAVLDPLSFVGQTQYNNWSGLILGISLFISIIVIIILITYSYLGMKLSTVKKRPSISTTTMVAMFFTLIGLGYMFVQMTLIQRLTLVVGHPIISMATIIPTLLISMGVASMAASKLFFHSPRSMIGALAIPVVTIFCYEHLLSSYIYSIASSYLYIRVIIVILTLIPLGLSLGLCFPLGLHAFRKGSEMITPIAWTANGGASVLGSIGAVLISLIFGFHAAINIANFCYLMAFSIFSSFVFLNFISRRSQVEMFEPTSSQPTKRKKKRKRKK